MKTMLLTDVDPAVLLGGRMNWMLDAGFYNMDCMGELEGHG